MSISEQIKNAENEVDRLSVALNVRGISEEKRKAVALMCIQYEILFNLEKEL